MEFAKNNVPKPKVKPTQASDKLSKAGDADNIASDDMFDNGFKQNSGKKNDDNAEFLNMLDQRHQAYSDEVQKIKRTFGFNL